MLEKEEWIDLKDMVETMGDSAHLSEDDHYSVSFDSYEEYLEAFYDEGIFEDEDFQ